MAAAPIATTKITPRRGSRSDVQPTGHWNTSAPIDGSARNNAVSPGPNPARVAYTALKPNRIPCDAPVNTIPTRPVGAMCANSRRRRWGDTRTGGASVVAASAIGTNDIDTRIDATMKSPSPVGSPAAIRSWPNPRPPIDTIM